MVPGGEIARCGTGMAHVWNETSASLYVRTYQILRDAGVDDKLAETLATERAVVAANGSARMT
jgi:hypothetical protein